MADHQTTDNTNTITVHVPIAFARRGGRKTVTTADGSPPHARRPRRQADTALVKALARAFRWRRLIEKGSYVTIQDLASAEKINASYVGRILRLTLRAPDIIEAILDGRQPIGMTLRELLQPFPLVWAKQREGTEA